MRTHNLGSLALLMLLAACTLPQSTTTPTGEDRPVTRESPAQEQQRLRAQRERAQRDGLLVFSAGTLKSAKVTRGAELAFQFEQVRATGPTKARPGTIGVPLNCRTGECESRRVTIRGKKKAARVRLAVVTLAPGLWRLSAARLSGDAPVRFRTPPPFEIRKGHATYLGAFVMAGSARGTLAPALPLARFSAVQSDMSRALDIFEQTRGRKLLNAMSKQPNTEFIK